MTDTSNRGLDSDKMDEQKNQEVHSNSDKASTSEQDMSKLGQKGGKASPNKFEVGDTQKEKTASESGEPRAESQTEE